MYFSTFTLPDILWPVRRICGIDECGRGALAGPLVAAGVILRTSKEKIVKLAKTPLKDSKKLKPHQHRKIYKALVKTSAQIAVEEISVRQINSKGIGWANREIFRRIIKRLDAEKYIADGIIKIGRIKGKTLKIKSLINADDKIVSTMAASIVAKVERDKIMLKLHRQFPKYGWKTNTGHGTKKHIEALLKHGPTKHHRSLFIETALKNKKAQNIALDKYDAI